MYHFERLGFSVIYENNVFVGFFFFPVLQTVCLEGTTWDGIREVLIIILHSYQTLYQLQVSWRSRCPIFAIVRDYRTITFFFFFGHGPIYPLRILSGTNLGVLL